MAALERSRGATQFKKGFDERRMTAIEQSRAYQALQKQLRAVNEQVAEIYGLKMLGKLEDVPEALRYIPLDKYAAAMEIGNSRLFGKPKDGNQAEDQQQGMTNEQAKALIELATLLKSQSAKIIEG